MKISRSGSRPSQSIIAQIGQHLRGHYLGCGSKGKPDHGPWKKAAHGGDRSTRLRRGRSWRRSKGNHVVFSREETQLAMFAWTRFIATVREYWLYWIDHHPVGLGRRVSLLLRWCLVKITPEIVNSSPVQGSRGIVDEESILSLLPSCRNGRSFKRLIAKKSF